MSLVNDMLRDLDSRQPDTSHNSDHLPSGLSRRPTAGAWRFVALGFMAVLLIALLFYVSVRLAPYEPEKIAEVTPQSKTETEKPDVKAPEVKAPVSAEAESIQAPGRASSVSGAALAGTQTALPQENKTQAELEQHLRLANAAVVAGQLTAPLQSSAYWYYRQALELDPNNATALDGMAGIAKSLITQAERARQQGEYAEAQDLLSRALTVAPDNQAAKALQQSLLQSAKPQEPAEKIAAADRKAPVADEQNPASSGTVAKLPPEGVPDSSGVSANWATRDQQARLDAEQLVARGQTASATQNLAAFIGAATEAGSVAPQSRRYLQALLLQLDKLDAAQELVVASLNATDKAYMQARVLEYQGELSQALNVLEQSYRGAETDEAYRALTASLYQTTGNFQAAEAHYRRLLEVFGPRARYWLGLALALDQQLRYQPASVAYRRARNASDTTQVIANFADRRLLQIGM